MNSESKNGDMTNAYNGDQLFSHPVDTTYVAPANKAAGAADDAADDSAVTYPVFSDRDR